MDLGDQCAEYVCIGELMQGSKFCCCGGKQIQRFQMAQSQSTADLGLARAKRSGGRGKGHGVGQFTGSVGPSRRASMVGDI